MPNAIGTNAIGPSFGAELAAAGLAGLAFSWGADGVFNWESLTQAEQTAVLAVYAAHNPTRADPNAAYAAALAAGLTITSASTPGLDGVYGCMPADQTALAGLMASIQAGLFPGVYQTKSDVEVTMTSAQFQAIATAVMAYVVALDRARRAALLPGGAWAAPAATATIA